MAGLLLLGACSSSDDSTDTQDPPGDTAAFELQSVSNGFGQQLPHQGTFDDGVSGPVQVELRSLDQMAELMTSGVLTLDPPVAFPGAPVLPDSRPGNHFFLAQFTGDVDPETPCESICTGVGTCDVDSLEVVTFDPVTHEEVVVPARVFIGGYTRNANGDLEQWVRWNSASGELELLRAEAEGFPGSEAPQLMGAEDFVSPSSMMFVMDADDDLSTFEAFPAAETVQLRIPLALCSTDGEHLYQHVVAATSVGGNPAGPSVVSINGQRITIPRDGAQAVDPTTDISLRFTEAIQPQPFGSMGQPFPSQAVSVVQGPPTAPSPHTFRVTPRSIYDLTQWLLLPDREFHGLDPEGPPTQLELAEVHVSVMGTQMSDLSAAPGAEAVEFSFLVDRGTSITNAPIVPESLVISRGGTRPGLSVLDLNGFGQSTGSHSYSLPIPLKGETRFPFDPNVTLNPSIRPILSPGTSSVNGGSAGVFTLTLDANLNSTLAGDPVLADASDLQYGASLDLVFRNAPPPFGCQAGGGNVCALDGLKTLAQNPDLPVAVAFPNLVSFAPHPNPPGLTFPPQCVAPLMEANEPTAGDGSVTNNLLVTGNPFPDTDLDIPPTGLLSGRRGDLPFYGPSFGQTQPQLCNAYGVRQQIGQFLYVVDRLRGEVVVLNSNRMWVIDRILVPGATSMALSPNLDVLAVTGMDTNTVTVIDVSPASATFHHVLAQVPVGQGPRGVAFDPLDEDILVCNELDNTISIIDPLTLNVRKTVASLVDAPFELAVTQRMDGFAFRRGVYFAFILGRNGEVAVFESGPDGVGGLGYDTTVGTLPYVFQGPRAITVDPENLDASVYIAYEGPVDPQTGMSGALGEGAVSRVHLESALQGPVLLVPGATPSFRDMSFRVATTLSEGDGQLSGIPTSLAFDELTNYADYPSPVSIRTSGAPAQHNGKALVRERDSGMRRTNRPQFLFAAVTEADVIDVVQLNLAGTPLLDTCVYQDGVQSIPVPNVRFLTGYFGQ